MGGRNVGCAVKRGGHVVADLGGLGIKAFVCNIAQQITLGPNSDIFFIFLDQYGTDFIPYHEFTSSLYGVIEGNGEYLLVFVLNVIFSGIHILLLV